MLDMQIIDFETRGCLVTDGEGRGWLYRICEHFLLLNSQVSSVILTAEIWGEKTNRSVAVREAHVRSVLPTNEAPPNCFC